MTARRRRPKKRVYAVSGSSKSMPLISSLRTDRWLLWPAIVTLLATIFLLFVCQMPGLIGFVLALVLGLGWPFALGLVLLVAVVMLVMHRVRLAASLVLAPLCVTISWTLLVQAATYLHLGITVLVSMEPSRASGKTSNVQQLTVYDWSTGLAGGPTTLLIRDVSDEIASPLVKHRTWASQGVGTEEECAGKVRHLVDHYYLCTFTAS